MGKEWFLGKGWYEIELVYVGGFFNYRDYFISHPKVFESIESKGSNCDEMEDTWWGFSGCGFRDPFSVVLKKRANRGRDVLSRQPR